MNTLKNFIQNLSSALQSAGFKPLEEFSAVDSMIYSDLNLGFYSRKNSSDVGYGLSCDGKTLYHQLEYEFEIRLMGISSDFADFKTFDEKCGNFYSALSESENFLLKTLKMGNTYQSLPLKRLARNVNLTARLSEEVSL